MDLKCLLYCNCVYKYRWFEIFFKLRIDIGDLKINFGFIMVFNYEKILIF